MSGMIQRLRRSIRYRTDRLILNFNRHMFFSNRMRMAIYRVLGLRADDGAMIWCGNRINHADRISIGRNSILGPGNVLLSQGGIEIGENVNISGFSFLISQEHDVASPMLATRLAPIQIHDYVWIATNVTILPGSVIGRGAVVAAGAVVTGNVPPCTIVAGVPARKIGERKDNFKYNTRDVRGLKWM
jgi:maltose O-acetyltransferase